ncbi:MAG: RimK/LysX family protein [Amphritea sp.]|nr:RimK/LysX family protein [Amphritea sp.]
MLQGCLATAQKQQEALDVAKAAAEQCASLESDLATLNSQQKASLRLLRDQAKAQQKAETLRNTDQSCEQLRQSLDNKTVVGAVEWSVVDYGNLQRIARARMDTGATTSSINATDITEFERNGERWVRFKLADGEEVALVLERYANIAQAGARKDRRLVVKLGIRLGGIEQVAEFTLKNRSHLNYEVLVGRNLLRDLMVVDVAQRYMLGGKPEPSQSESP